MNTKNILVTGGRSPVALHLSRMLHDSKYNVYGAESEPYHLSKKSNAIKKSYIVPKPNENHYDYIQALLDICQKNRISLIIPTCEELFHIAKSKHLFNEHSIEVFCDKLKTLHLLHNKYSFIQYLNENQYIHPKTYEFTSIEELVSRLKEFLNQKIVLKAVYSRFASKVYILDSVDQIPSIEVCNEHPWILQEFIDGTQYCSYTVAINGKIVAHTCYPTLYTAGLGANVFFKHVNEPKIEELVERLVKELNFTGQIAFDFIRDSNGEFYPIECNPRSTSGLHLFDGNKKFPSIFVQRNAVAKETPLKEKTFKLGIPMLMYGLSEGFLLRHPFSFLRDFIFAQDVVYSSKDKKPFIYQGVILLVMVARKMKSKKGLTELTTIDIEWSGK